MEKYAVRDSAALTFTNVRAEVKAEKFLIAV
jgi:hypothetical protein